MTTKAQTVLIVEDEKPMARALNLKLTHEGFAVEMVHDGLEAVSFLKKEPKKFDLIILDLVMPKLDGFGVLDKIKSMDISVPAIVLSNLSQDEDRRRAEKLGARNFFVKSNTTLAQIVLEVKNILKST